MVWSISLNTSSAVYIFSARKAVHFSSNISDTFRKSYQSLAVAAVNRRFSELTELSKQSSW